MKKSHKFVYMALVGVLLLGSAMVLPAGAQQTVLTTDVPGSFLVFPLFDVTTGNSTHIRITDTTTTNTVPQGTTSVRVHFEYICPGTSSVKACDTGNVPHRFTDHGTIDIDVANEFPPCTQGFIVAFAVADGGSAAGNPVAYDSLIGSYHITFGGADPFAPNTSETGNALAIQSAKAPTFDMANGLFNPSKVLGTTNANLINTDLAFGTTSSSDYVALPKVLHGNYRAVTASSETWFILLTLQMTANGDDNTATTVDVKNWGANEDNFSGGGASFFCWTRVRAETIDPRFKRVANGNQEFGSVKISSKQLTRPILGAIEERGSYLVGASLGGDANGALGSASPTAVTGASIRPFFHCPTYVNGNPTAPVCTPLTPTGREVVFTTEGAFPE